MLEDRLSKTIKKTFKRHISFKKQPRVTISLIRFSLPFCHMGANRGNEKIRYPSRKMASLIKAESHLIEFPSMLEAEDDFPEYWDKTL
jgi:hypothetical protein